MELWLIGWIISMGMQEEDRWRDIFGLLILWPLFIGGVIKEKLKEKT